MQRERQVKGLRTGGYYCTPRNKRGCIIGVSPSEKIVAQAVRALEGEKGVSVVTTGLSSHWIDSIRYGMGAL